MEEEEVKNPEEFLEDLRKVGRAIQAGEVRAQDLEEEVEEGEDELL